MQVDEEHLIDSLNYSWPIYIYLLIHADGLSLIFPLPDVQKVINHISFFSCWAKQAPYARCPFMKSSPVSS